MEQIERLARDLRYEIHVYSQRVQDLATTEKGSRGKSSGNGATEKGEANGGVPCERGRVVWHKVPDVPGPHLLKYIWWFSANATWRWWDQHLRGLKYDLVYTPGVNCLNADVSAVHIVFGEFRRLAEEELRFRNNPALFWPRLLHRKLYYALLAKLEKRVYTKPSLTITVVSQQVAEEIRRHYARASNVYVLRNAIDASLFDVQSRLDRRSECRRYFGLVEDELVLLLVGNDWKKKGLPWVLEALARLQDLPLKLLVVGSDDPDPFKAAARRFEVDHRVLFLDPSPDVVRFYAAADVYVGPSLHDSFAFPPFEAMASGLPVITSAQNGGSEIMTDGINGLVLKDPRDVEKLSDLIRLLYQDPCLRNRLGEAAARAAREYTWERNTEELQCLLQQLLVKRQRDLRSLTDSFSDFNSKQ